MFTVLTRYSTLANVIIVSCLFIIKRLKFFFFCNSTLPVTVCGEYRKNISVLLFILKVNRTCVYQYREICFRYYYFKQTTSLRLLTFPSMLIKKIWWRDYILYTDMVDVEFSGALPPFFLYLQMLPSIIIKRLYHRVTSRPAVENKWSPFSAIHIFHMSYSARWMEISSVYLHI